MRPIRSLAIYVAVVFVGGALLAPWLYDAAQWAGAHWEAAGGLAQNPFYRFVHRAILGLAVAGLWPLLRACGMLNRREMGLAKTGRAGAEMAGGFAVGFGSLALVAIAAIGCGGRRMNLGHDLPETARVLLGATVAALVVGLVEELIFRGAVFGILRKRFPWPAALAVSSVVYAAAHFLQKAPGPTQVAWWSGLELLPKMWGSPADGLAFVPAFFTLLVAGAILALAYQRTGALFFPIGLHAGWIFWLRSYRFLTRDAPGARAAIWGTDKLIDGWMALVILAGVLVVALGARTRRRMESEEK